MSDLITLTTPGDAREWCKKYWDTYGFDYDIESCHGSIVTIWPLEGTNVRHMKRDLEESGCTIN
jgi:hypothetical protein